MKLYVVLLLLPSLNHIFLRLASSCHFHPTFSHSVVLILLFLSSLFRMMAEYEIQMADGDRVGEFFVKFHGPKSSTSPSCSPSCSFSFCTPYTRDSFNDSVAHISSLFAVSLILFVCLFVSTLRGWRLESAC